MSEAVTAPGARRGAARRRAAALLVYALALAASLAVIHRVHGPPEPGPGVTRVDLPASALGRAGDPTPVFVYESGGPSARVPVIVLHGAPGSGADFAVMAPLLEGRRVIAPDQLGFGGSTVNLPADLSIRTQAGAVLALLDALRIERAHVVGWSIGGGVAMHLADQAPERVASLTLLGSIGTQEHEGSGSYFFEHVKYRAGLVALAGLDLLPHFGLLGSARSRTLWLRSFMDTDQRQIRPLLPRLVVPTLVLHGRDDVLVPVRAAIEMHELIPGSRLAVIDANHFIPFLQAREAADILNPFLARHDEPGVPPEPGRLWLAPPDGGGWASRLGERVWLPWWAWVAALAVLVRRAPLLTLAAAGLLVAGLAMDMFVAFAGVALGLAAPLAARTLGLGRAPTPAQARDWADRLERAPIAAGWRAQFVAPMRSLPPPGPRAGTPAGFALYALARGAAIIVWTLAGLGMVQALGWPLARTLDAALGPAGLLLALLPAAGIAGLATSLPSRMARQRARAWVARWFHHEWWPAWLFYPPLIVYVLFMSRRFGGPRTGSCANPGITPGGGVVGESKHALLAASPSPRVLPAYLVRAGPTPAERAAEARALIDRTPSLAFPVILKPDSAQRGFGLKLARSPDDLLPYFEEMTRDAVLQPYHPGPCEAGVLWARDPDAPPGAPRGRIFSITRKEFQRLSADGRRTLEELIHAHPRLRKQADVFLERFTGELARVPAAGELIRMAIAGNHAQGTLFRDGSDLATPELLAAVDAVCGAFAGGGTPGSLDFSRLDIRYESDELLRRGEGFAVVELNGSFSESTNIYDPSRGPLWAWGVVFRQWRTVFELGARRRAAGVEPMTYRAFIALLWNYYKDRPGSAVSS